VASLSAAEFRCHKCRLAAERQANSAAGLSLTKFILKADIVIDIIALNCYIGGSSISPRGPEAPRGSQKAGGYPGLVLDLWATGAFWSQALYWGSPVLGSKIRRRVPEPR